MRSERGAMTERDLIRSGRRSSSSTTTMSDERVTEGRGTSSNASVAGPAG